MTNTDTDRAMHYIALIRVAQARMEKGAELAFDRHHPRQKEACRRMLRYIAICRWLYVRALRADAETTETFRASCVGRPWPYGGIDDGDETYFRLVGEYECADMGADTDEMPVAATVPA